MAQPAKQKERGNQLMFLCIPSMTPLRSGISFVPCNYEDISAIFPGIQVRFVDAGHLLGSSSIEITVTENKVTKTIVFSGDIGNTDQPLIRNPQYLDPG